MFQLVVSKQHISTLMTYNNSLTSTGGIICLGLSHSQRSEVIHCPLV